MQEKQRAEHLLVAVPGLAREFELQYLIFASNATKTRTCSSGLGLQWGQTCADRTLQSAHCQPRVLLNTGGKLYNKSVPLYCVLCTVYCGDHSTLELTGDWAWRCMLWPDRSLHSACCQHSSWVGIEIFKFNLRSTVHFFILHNTTKTSSSRR